MEQVRAPAPVTHRDGNSLTCASPFAQAKNTGKIIVRIS